MIIIGVFMAKHKMATDIFRQVKDFIYEKCGISFTENKIYLLEDRLSKRLDELNMSSYEEYLYYLKYDPNRRNELKSLYNSITTNETSFYRDMVQLTAFRTGVLPMVLKSKNPRDKTLRVWSAGCSTGEEPYTLAMMFLDENLPMKGWRIEIIASDISDRVLQSARKGVYGDYAIRNTNPVALKRFFTKQNDGYHVNPEVKRMVRFMSINLFDTYETRNASKIDIIFCRNVIIYFDDDSKRKVMGHFYDALTKDGVLVLGFSETLINLTRAFKAKGINRCIVYEKV